MLGCAVGYRVTASEKSDRPLRVVKRLSPSLSKALSARCQP